MGSAGGEPGDKRPIENDGARIVFLRQFLKLPGIPPCHIQSGGRSATTGNALFVADSSNSPGSTDAASPQRDRQSCNWRNHKIPSFSYLLRWS